MRRFRFGLPGFAGAVLLALFLALALFPDAVAGRDPLEQEVSRRLLPPGREHPFGTDGFGRDVFSRVVHGTRISLGCAVLAFGAAAVLGISAGTVSAWRPGALDILLQRLVDLLLAVPFLALALVVIVAMTPSPLSVGVAIAAGLAPPIARVARSAALSVLREPYVTAARLGGAGSLRILLRHVLPNAASPIVAQLTGYLAMAITAEATLSFLGLGVPAPFPSWGRMLLEGARQYLESAPWIAGFPGLAVGLAVAGTSLLGEALRDLLDPRTRYRRPASMG